MSITTIHTTTRGWRITGPTGLIAAGRVDHGAEEDQREAAESVLIQLERGGRVRAASMTEIHRSRFPSELVHATTNLQDVRVATRQLAGILDIEADRNPSSVRQILETVLPQVRAYVARFEGLVR